MHVIILLERECYFPQSPSSHHQPVRTWPGICAADRTTKRRKKTPYKKQTFFNSEKWGDIKRKGEYGSHDGELDSHRIMT